MLSDLYLTTRLFISHLYRLETDEFLSVLVAQCQHQPYDARRVDTYFLFIFSCQKTPYDSDFHC